MYRFSLHWLWVDLSIGSISRSGRAQPSSTFVASFSRFALLLLILLLAPAHLRLIGRILSEKVNN
jgi:hypothetical protein